MKKYILFVLMMILSISFFAGCGDDDDTTAPVGERTMIYGEAYVTPDLRMRADFVPTDPEEARVDSIEFGGRIKYISDGFWDTYADKYYYFSYYQNINDNSEFEAGDTLDITFYKGNEHATCMVKLLFDENAPVIVAPPNYDTMEVGETVALTWESTEYADWYGIWINYYWDSSGYQAYRGYNLFTTDTTISFNDDYFFDDGYFYIYIMGVAGPLPGQDNVVSATMLGTMHSSTNTITRTYYIGTGMPSGPVTTTKQATEENPDEIRHKILESFFK